MNRQQVSKYRPKSKPKQKIFPVEDFLELSMHLRIERTKKILHADNAKELIAQLQAECKKKKILPFVRSSFLELPRRKLGQT